MSQEGNRREKEGNETEEEKKRMEKERGVCRRRYKERKRLRKFLFWNVAGLSNKDEDFWKFVKNFDFVSLCETWVDEKGWNRLKNKLPDTHEWRSSFAKKEKEKRRGRFKGGFVIGRSKGWDRQGNSFKVREEEGLVLSEINLRKEKLSIVSIYGTKGEKKDKRKNR